jgi:hypothetical protein
VHFGQGTQDNSYGSHGNTGRTREERGTNFIEALRRQLDCRARDKRIRGVQQANDEGTSSLEKSARRAWVPVFVRVDTVRGEQIRLRTIMSFLTWRRSSETDAAALRRGWDDGAPRFVPPATTRRAPRLPASPVPQRIGIVLVPRGNATVLPACGTYGSSCEEATDIQGTRPAPDARLAETSMIPAGHGHY